MSQKNPNAERYIAIARACLKAINDTAAKAGDREQKIQAVYEAIDTAFKAEFKSQREAMTVMATVLERIASGELSADKAADLARQTLHQQPQTHGKTRMH